MKNFYNNLKNGLTSVRVGNTLDSILSRICLASLILMTIGVGQAWGDSPYTVNLANTDTKSWNDGKISLSFSNVSMNGNGYELASTGLGSSEKDKLRGYVVWSNLNAGYTLKVTQVVAHFKTDVNGRFLTNATAYGIYGRVYCGEQSAYTHKMCENSGYPTDDATISNESGFGNTIYFTSGRNSAGGKTYLNGVTLTYTRTPNNYTIVYNGNGSTHGTTASTPATYDDNVTFAQNGFYRAKYVVTYDANGGACSLEADTAYYSFEGWATSAGGAKVYDGGQTTTSAPNLATSGNANLYAKWGSGTTAVTLPTSSDLTAPVYDGDGEYSFAGWYVSTDENKKVLGASYTPTSNVTLKAKWTLTKEPSFSGAVEGTSHTLKVGETFNFVFDNTSTTTPSSSSSDNFYYVISQTTDPTGNRDGSEHPNDVISISGNTITALNNGVATIKFYQKADATNNIAEGESSTYTFTVSRNVPEFTWNTREHYYYNETIAHFFKSSQTETAISVTSTDAHKLIATIVDSALVMYNKAGTARVTMTQAENYYWAEHTEYRDITPEKANTHVEFTVTSANQASINVSESNIGTVVWDSNGFRMSDGTVIGDRPDNSVILKIEGIPDSLFFTMNCEQNGVGALKSYPAANDYTFEVYERVTTTGEWKWVWTCDNSSWFSAAINQKMKLDSTTQYLRLRYKGSCWGRFENIRVTEKKHFKTDSTSFDFKTNLKNAIVASKSFKFKHANAGYTVKAELSDSTHYQISLDNSSFSGSVIIPNTGGDRMDSSVVYVKYYPSATGDAEETHNATITFSDQLSNSAIVTLTGKTQAKLSTHLVYKGSASYSVDAANIAATDLFEVRDANNALVSNPTITLSKGETSVFDLANSNTELDPKCGGSATVTASYTGDETYAAASDLDQTITIARLADMISFNGAKASMVVGEELDITGWVSAVSESEITVSSLTSNYLVLEGNTLRAVGKGNGKLQAVSAGNCTYNSGSKTLDITVRNPNDPCESTLLYNSGMIIVGKYGDGNNRVLTIGEGPQDQLTFKAWKYSSWTNDSDAPKITFLNAKDEEITTETITGLSTSEPSSPNQTIDLTKDKYKGTVKLKFSAPSTLNQYFQEIKVTQQAYLTASMTSVTMSSVKACVQATGQFDVSYSDISRIQLSQTNDDFTYEVWSGDTKLDGFDNDCGEYGTYTVKFFYTPQAKGDYSNTVTLSASGKSQTITLSGTAAAPDREIVWDIPLSNTITATQSVDLTAYAKTACADSPAGSVYYTWSSIPEIDDAATIVGSRITFNKASSVTVTAHTVSSDDYNDAATVGKVWTVSKVGIVMEKKPTITSTITCGDLSTAVTYNSNDFKAVSALDNTVVVPGSIAYVPASFDHAGLTDITFNFTPTDLSVYEATPFTVQVDVQHIASNATPSAEAITYGAAISSSTLSNSGTTAGTWTWNTADNSAILDAGEHTLNVHFTPENSNYSELDATVTLTVNKANAGVTPAAVEFTYGGKASDQILSTATGSLAGTWSWTDSQKDATLAAGNYEMDVRFTPTDADNYNVLDTKVTVTVNKANAGVTPAAVEFTYGGKASDQTLSTATGSLAGTWSWIDAQKDATLAVGNYEMNVRFTPTDADNYNVLDTKVTVTVNKANAGVTPAAVEFTYGGKASDQTLNTATGTLAGTWSWTDSQMDATLAAGNYEMDVRFTPTDADNYNVLNTKVTVTVNKATTSLNWTNAPEDLAYNATGVTYTASSASDGTITYSIIAGGAYASIDGNGVLTIIEPGHTITIQASQAAGTNHTAPVAITVDVTIAAAPSAPTFNNVAGDNDWQNADNWSNGEVPSGENPDVIISGELIVNEDVTVGALTIESTGSVTVITNGTLTVNGESAVKSEYGDLYVANGGEVNINGTLHVGDLTVEASIGTENGSAQSGQIAQAEHIVYANAYIEINMVPNDGPMDDSKWYGFTVPFAVNAHTGITRKVGDAYENCSYGHDIIIAEYDAIKRLNTGNGWKYISNPTLNPGQFYFFGADGGYNTFRFKASASAYTPATAASLTVNGSTTDPNANWNGVGNSMLQHATASYEGGSYVQVYKNGLDAYEAIPTSSATFVVGCPFFIQAKEATSLVLNVQTETTAKYYAPSRVGNEEKAACVQLVSVDGGYVDHIYVSATDKEQNAYMLGHDLAKAGVSALVPQLWVNQYNQKLCVHEAAMQGNNAQCALGLYAPKSGDYLLSVAQDDNAEIYLTMNGQPIWNLSQSEYMLALNKGTNESFGLMIVNAPQVTTGVDDVAGDEAQVSKMILNNQLYIIKNGQVFDATGKKVK